MYQSLGSIHGPTFIHPGNQLFNLYLRGSWHPLHDIGVIVLLQHMTKQLDLIFLTLAPKPRVGGAAVAALF